MVDRCGQRGRLPLAPSLCQPLRSPARDPQELSWRGAARRNGGRRRLLLHERQHLHHLGSRSVLSTPGPEVKGIEVKDSTITVTGDKVGELKATINNTTKDAVTLRAVACSCAGMVQLGTDTGVGEITPISTGTPIAAGASGELGGPTSCA
jgi:hypothetical protein